MGVWVCGCDSASYSGRWGGGGRHPHTHTPILSFLLRPRLQHGQRLVVTSHHALAALRIRLEEGAGLRIQRVKRLRVGEGKPSAAGAAATRPSAAPTGCASAGTATAGPAATAASTAAAESTLRHSCDLLKLSGLERLRELLHYLERLVIAHHRLVSPGLVDDQDGSGLLLR